MRELQGATRGDITKVPRKIFEQAKAGKHHAEHAQ
jgi:hypothetical protein